MKKIYGFTMVELLIGLVLSSIVSIAMLMFFKQSMYISLEARKDAEIDTKIQATLITIKKIVQDAGFGIGQHNDIVIGEYESNPALFWRRFDSIFNAAVICRGIGEKIDNSGMHRIVLLEKNCTADVDIDSTGWTENQQLASFLTTIAEPVIKYELESNPGCNPFGISTHNGEGKKTITIEANPDEDNLAHKKTSIRICLLNILEEEPIPAP